jgi:hypothetical protein
MSAHLLWDAFASMVNLMTSGVKVRCSVLYYCGGERVVHGRNQLRISAMVNSKRYQVTNTQAVTRYSHITRPSCPWPALRLQGHV